MSRAGPPDQPPRSDTVGSSPITEEPPSTMVAGQDALLSMAGDSSPQRIELDDGVSWSAAEAVTDALVVTLEPVEDDSDGVVQYALRVENIADVTVGAPVQFDVAFDEIGDVQIDGDTDWDCAHRDGVVSCIMDEDFEAAAVSIILMSSFPPTSAATAQLTIASLATLVAGLGALVITRRRRSIRC